MREKQYKDWSEDGQFFFLEGQAWGLDRLLRTVYAGTEAEIRGVGQQPEILPETLTAKSRVGRPPTSTIPLTADVRYNRSPAKRATSKKYRQR